MKTALVAALANVFLREIPSEHGEVSVVLAEGSPHVSVYSGPFSWQIELSDVSAVIALLGNVLEDRSRAHPQLRLANGNDLHIGIGIEGTHCWISSAEAHLRLEVDVARQLLGYVSEARGYITRLARELQPQGEAAPC